MPTFKERIEAKKEEMLMDSIINVGLNIQRTIDSLKKNASNSVRKVPEYEKALAELEKITTQEQFVAFKDATYKLDSTYATKPVFKYTVEDTEQKEEDENDQPFR